MPYTKNNKPTIRMVQCLTNTCYYPKLSTNVNYYIVWQTNFAINASKQTFCTLARCKLKIGLYLFSLFLRVYFAEQKQIWKNTFGVFVQISFHWWRHSKSANIIKINVTIIYHFILPSRIIMHSFYMWLASCSGFVRFCWLLFEKIKWLLLFIYKKSPNRT